LFSNKRGRLLACSHNFVLSFSTEYPGTVCSKIVHHTMFLYVCGQRRGSTLTFYIDLQCNKASYYCLYEKTGVAR
jgi:hypothetical protein